MVPTCYYPDEIEILLPRILVYFHGKRDFLSKDCKPFSFIITKDSQRTVFIVFMSYKKDRNSFATHFTTRQDFCRDCFLIF